MLNAEKITQDLREGKVIILPTDTIYGISCLVSNTDARARIAKVKGRDDEKKFVVLIGDKAQLDVLGITPNDKECELMQKYWPGALTIAFTPELAVRFPAYPELCEVIRQVGPIISTSANSSGERPAQTVDEAKKVFGDRIDAYYDGDTLCGSPSTVIKVENEEVIILRHGAIVIY